MNRITGYVLNDFLKFERKIYSVFDQDIGRPIYLKTVLFFLVALAIIFGLSFIPFTGFLVNWIAPGIKVVIAGVIAAILTDVGTENRTPASFFKSFLQYHLMRWKKESYYKGKVMKEEKPVAFGTTFNVAKPKKQRQPKKKGKAYRFKKGVTVS